MSLAKNIEWGEKAVLYVKRKVGRGASSNNITAHVVQSMGGIEAMMKNKTYKANWNNPLTLKRANAINDVNWYVNNMSWKYAKPGDTPFKTECRIKAEIAKQYKVGNCGEQARIAYFWLEKHGVSPIDLVRFSAGGVYDHAWVLIGRPQNKSLANIAEWGETDTVWCDPWQGRYGMVYSVNDLIKKKVVNLDAKYKLDSVENVQAGLPRSILRD